MGKTFHPYPAPQIAKLALFSLAASAIIYYFRDLFGRSLLGVLLVVWLVAIIYMLVAFMRSRFHTIELDEQTITYRAGILTTRKVVLPYSKITESSFTQTIAQRIFGVGNLNIDTAGGSNVAIRMADVKQADLKEILDSINSKTGKDGGI